MTVKKILAAKRKESFDALCADIVKSLREDRENLLLLGAPEVKARLAGLPPDDVSLLRPQTLPLADINDRPLLDCLGDAATFRRIRKEWEDNSLPDVQASVLEAARQKLNSAIATEYGVIDLIGKLDFTESGTLRATVDSASLLRQHAMQKPGAPSRA